MMRVRSPDAATPIWEHHMADEDKFPIYPLVDNGDQGEYSPDPEVNRHHRDQVDNKSDNNNKADSKLGNNSTCPAFFPDLQASNGNECPSFSIRRRSSPYPLVFKSRNPAS